MRRLSAMTVLLVLSSIPACGDDATATTNSGSTTGGTTGGPTTGVTPIDPTTGGASGTVGTTEAASGSESTADTVDDTTGSNETGSSSDTGTTAEDSTGASETTGLVACETVGERVYMGDGCNFCDCTDAGLDNCTARDCTALSDGCEYDGVDYAYAEHFDADDDCNVCVCAASGLACTRREACDAAFDQGAILLESADAPCGPFEDFTGAWLMGDMAPLERTGALDYENDGPLYPEGLADTSMTVRVTFPEDGYIVCRIPSPGQESLDLEAVLEWESEDGAFDEGQHTYVTRSESGFLFAAWGVSVLDVGDLTGTYSPGCPDAGGVSISPRWNDKGPATALLSKTCEVDIGLTVGDWTEAFGD